MWVSQSGLNSEQQSVTVPGPVLFPGPNFSGTGTGTFFQDQIFLVPVFFPEPIFSDTGTGTFFPVPVPVPYKKGRIPGTGTKPVPYGTF